MSRYPITDFRHAFGIDYYPVTGALSGEFHIYDKYQMPQGFGRMAIADGVAYGEPFEEGQAGLTFDGAGVRIDGIELRKRTGRVTGAAYIGWNGTYSFNADARAIPMDSVVAVAYPQAPFTGELFFAANGTGTFNAPRYEVRGRIDDLFIADEGVGQVTGALSVRDQTLTIDVLEVASSRLAISGSGRIALTPQADADVRFRFTDTSLDPYLRAVKPGFSPFTTAVASGYVRAFGELRNPEQLRAEVVAEHLDLGLFDYHLRNDGPIRLAMDDQVVRLDRLRLVGEGTQLEMVGDVRPDRSADLAARPRGRQPRHPAGRAPRRSQFRRGRGAGRRARHAERSRSSPPRPRWSRAGFATSRCRMRSSVSTAPSPSTVAG